MNPKETSQKKPRHLALLVLVLVVTSGLAAYSYHAAKPPLIVLPRPYVSSPAADAELLRLAKKYGKEYRASSNYEEWFIKDFYEDSPSGYFVDVGASHWIAGSNSIYLELAKGWKGLAIDAQEEEAEGYLKHRPNSVFVAYFISDESGDIQDLYVPYYPGLATGHSEYYEGNEDLKVKQVPTITLNDLFKLQSVTKVDFLNLDIEGFEMEALRGLDLEKFHPSLICIEAHLGNVKKRQEKEQYLGQFGFEKIEPWSASDKQNDYYSPGGVKRWDSVPNRIPDVRPSSTP